jgi:hypothetical protein
MRFIGANCRHHQFALPESRVDLDKQIMDFGKATAISLVVDT